MNKKSKRKADRIALELPAELNNFIQQKADEQLTNKSALIRGILADWWKRSKGAA